jgi:fatty acid CoA ligase FadD9
LPPVIPVTGSLSSLDPTCRRFVARYPSLAELVEQVLEGAARIRELRAGALVERGFPDPAFGERYVATRHERHKAVEQLERAETGTEEEIDRAVARVLFCLAAHRAESHALTARRQMASAEKRSGLIAELRSWTALYNRLESEARKLLVRRVPWQIALSSNIPPGTAVSALEITGYDLPTTPAAAKAWGERCCLCGRHFGTDSRLEPEVRWRSLDSVYSTHCDDCHGLTRRFGSSLEAVRDRCGDAVARAARSYSQLFEDYVCDPAHPTFLHLPLRDYPSMAVTLNNLFRVFARRPLFGARGAAGSLPALGVRDRVAVAVDDAKSGYRWRSYGETRERALRLSRALEQHGVSAGARVGILFTANRQEFYDADFACVFSKLVSVGLQANLDDRRLGAIAEQTGLEALVCDRTSLERARESGLLDLCPGLRVIVVCDAAEAVASDSAFSVLSSEQVFAEPLPDDWRSASGIGGETPAIYGDQEGWDRAAREGISPDGDEDLYSIVFTSGSTGDPKGIAMTRLRWAEEMLNEVNLWPYVVVSFQPSALGTDRVQVWNVAFNGGRVGFARRGAALFEDIAAIRPTLLDVAPVVWNALYARYRRLVGDPDLTRSQAAAARKGLCDSMGGRLSIINTGGAACDPGVKKAMEELFGVSMGEGYGTTETGFVARNGVLRDDIDYRLIDRPDLGYTSSDLPNPRGELAVKTERARSGYYQGGGDRDSFTDDGYFLTGDLVEIGPQRQLRILGRSKEIFKLAGAEFVSAQELERCYGTSELVEAIFVTGSPVERQIVAVVVPASESSSEAEVLRDLLRIGRRQGRRACELPAGVIVEPRSLDGVLPWTTENGLLTPSWKLNRRALSERYGSAVEALYGRLAGMRDSLPPPEPESEQDGVERLRRVAGAILSLELEEVDASKSFAELGGDSLSAMDFGLRVEDVFGAKGEGASWWLEDAALLVETPLQALAERLGGGATEREVPAPAAAAEPRSTPAKPTTPVPAQVVAAASSSARPREQDLAAVLQADATSVPHFDPVPPRATEAHVLLTGATGFLGSHLLACLDRTLPPETRIYALVRAASDEAAADRLRLACRRASLPEPSVVATPETGRVVAIAGELSEPRFALAPERWHELDESVGLIYHVAGQVSDQAGYLDLRASNVDATRHVLELAVGSRAKALHLVSSLNVAGLATLAGGNDLERPPVSRLLSARALAATSGYAQSKWVAERLVDAVWRQAGGALRASVSRPALLTWSQRSGFANEDDWLSRILSTCLQIESVPVLEEVGVPRWYPETAASVRGIDMVPVDFAAEAIALLGRMTFEGLTEASLPGPFGPTPALPVYHVSNPNEGEDGFVTNLRLIDLLMAAALESGNTVAQSRSFESVSYREWKARAEAAGAPVVPLLEQFSDAPPSFRPTRSTRFESLLARSGVSCPAIGAPMMAAYLAGQDRASGG